MATFAVNTTADIVDGNLSQLSLREAVAQANATAAADTIVFGSLIEGQTLTLIGGELVLANDVFIDGDKNDDGSEVTLSGGGQNRILSTFGNGTDVTLQDLTVEQGFAYIGGAMRINGGSIVLSSSTIRDSYAGGNHATQARGGAIYAETGSRVSILDSAIVYNSTGERGGYGSAISGRDNVTILIRNSLLAGNSAQGEDYLSAGGALYLGSAGMLVVEDSVISNNGAFRAGGLETHSTATIVRTTIADNGALRGGGIVTEGRLTLTDSSVVSNSTNYSYAGVYEFRNGGVGGGILASGELVVRNSIITGNLGEDGEYSSGSGGIVIYGSSLLDIANSIVVGNGISYDTRASDIVGVVTRSNAHNIFGGPITGDVAGDRENVNASAIFAGIDPDTGGGQLSAEGIVPLRNSTANPAVGASDVFASMPTDQTGAIRPLPAGTLPDIGAAELNLDLSATATANNDKLSGTSGGNTISGLAGNDRIYGQAGNDTLNGDDGSDTFDGGTGNDKINGGTGIDTVRYDVGAAVRIDISGSIDTAKRGTETDTLTGIEGMLGSTANDTLIGDGARNWFRGQDGKDTQTGRAGVDTFDFNATADSPVGSGRDVITDFTHLTDKIDLSAIDADTGVSRDQAFRWVGTSSLTGAGQVGYFTSGTTTIIRGSNDADFATEFEIQLNGMKTPTEVDFYL